jgi:RHS repeat-associated protein
MTQSGLSNDSKIFYDALARPYLQVNFDGTHTLTEYDDRQRVRRVTLDADKDGQYDRGEPSTSFEYNYTTHGDVKVFQTKTIIHDDTPSADTVIVDEASLDGKMTWHREHDVDSHTATTIDKASGVSTTTAYSPAGDRLVQTYKHGLQSSSVHLNKSGVELSREDYGRDAFKRVDRTESPLGRVTTSIFQPSGKPTELRDGTHVTLLNAFDKGYDVTEAKVNDRNVFTPTNQKGQTTSTSGGGAIPTTFAYDQHTGQLTGMTTFAGGAITNTGGATTGWTYEPETGFLIGKKYAGSADFDIGYNHKPDSGQLHTVVRPGSTQTINYNTGTGQVSSITYKNGGGTTTIAYDVEVRDAKGRVRQLKQTVNGVVLTTNYVYENDRLKSESQPHLGGGYEVVYGHYPETGVGPGGRPNALHTVSLENAGVVVQSTLTYDQQAGRLHSVAGPGGADVYAYVGGTSGLIDTVTHANGTVTKYAYEDGTGRLKSVTTKLGATVLYSITYEFNGLNQRREAKIEQRLPDGTVRKQTYTYTYDQWDHVNSATAVDTVTAAPVSNRQFGYTFDALGNRTDSGFTPNALNQYTSVPGGLSIDYDDRGNLTQYGGDHFAYDERDRLVEFHNVTTRATYTYDFDGRRTGKTLYETDGAGGWDFAEARTFAYDGWNIIAEYRRLEGEDVATLLREYTWGVGLAGNVGALLTVTDHAGSTPATYTAHHDGNGNLVSLTDAAGAVVASYEYDPFGKILSATGSAAGVSSFRHAGQYYDAESRQYSYIFRYYHPELQLWTSRDPLQEEGGVNLNAFNKGDPINHFDALGLEPIALWPSSMSGEQRAAMLEAARRQEQALQRLAEEYIRTHDLGKIRWTGSIFGDARAKVVGMYGVAWSDALWNQKVPYVGGDPFAHHPTFGEEVMRIFHKNVKWFEGEGYKIENDAWTAMEKHLARVGARNGYMSAMSQSQANFNAKYPEYADLATKGWRRNASEEQRFQQQSMLIEYEGHGGLLFLALVRRAGPDILAAWAGAAKVGGTASGGTSSGRTVPGSRHALAKLPDGSFSIPTWYQELYPKRALPLPRGPYRLLQGGAYDNALADKKAANAVYRDAREIRGIDFQVHEILPVKFGGSPTDPLNKVVLPTHVHSEYTTWWRRIQDHVER